MEFLNRKEAIDRGLNKYFTGNPCKRGHIAPCRVDNYGCVICLSERALAWNRANPDSAKRACAKHKNRPEVKIRNRALEKVYKETPKNKERAKILYQKWYRERGAAKLASQRTLEARAKRRARYAERMDQEIQYRLAKLLRGRLKGAIRNNHRNGSAVRDLGCTIEFLKNYLERQFTDAMTWRNWGAVWHIDHISPLSAFDLTKPEQVKMACHYKNLRPLPKEINYAKAAKILRPIQLPLSFEARP